MKPGKISALSVLVSIVMVVFVITVLNGNAASPQESTPKEIKIGAVHPMSGMAARPGELMTRGLILAIEEINAAGGIKSLGGAKLVLRLGDSQSKVEVGQSEAERLIQEGVVCLMGAGLSAITFNTTQVAERAKIPFIVDTAVADNILERGFRYVFRVQPNQTNVSKGAAVALKSLRDKTRQPVNTVVFMHEDSSFGTSCADTFKKSAPDYGIKVLADIPFSLKGLTDLTTELTRVKALNPDLLLYSGYINDIILMVRTAKELKLPVKGIMGVSSMFSEPDVIKELGRDADYLFDANHRHDIRNPRTQELMKRYKAKYGEDLSVHSTLVHECVYVLADALERAKSTDPERLRNAIAATNYKDHLFPYPGPVKFDNKGECVNALSIVMQTQGGKIYQVLPIEIGERDPLYPMVPWDKR